MSVSRNVVLFVCAQIIGGYGSGGVAAESLQAGLWQFTSKTERHGVEKPRQTRSVCLTPEAAAKFGPTAFQSLGTENATCAVSDWQATADGARWRIHCVIGNTKVETLASFVLQTPEKYAAQFNSSVTVGGEVATSMMTMEGRRIGECPK